jgi:hypothetical protein
MSAALAPPPAFRCDEHDAMSRLFGLLPACVEELSADYRQHGALPVYGQWSSCSSFEPPLQLCIDDATVMQQLVSATNGDEGLQLLLLLASTSLSRDMAAASAWLDAGLCSSITRALAADQSTATRKLAFDLAFVIAHNRLQVTSASSPDVSDHLPDFGFEDLVRAAGGMECAAAAREYQVAALFVVSAPLAARFISRQRPLTFAYLLLVYRRRCHSVHLQTTPMSRSRYRR